MSGAQLAVRRSATRPGRGGGALVGADIGGTNVKLVRLQGRRVQAHIVRPTPREARSLLRVLVTGVRELDGGRRARSPRVPAVAVGIGICGILDHRRARLDESVHLPFLNGFPLRRELAARLRRRVFLETDANAGAIAESCLGAGRAFSRMLYLTLGTGLGAALVVDGEPVRVSRHTIGHAAHIRLLDADRARSQSSESRREHGPRCSCGRRGCAESLLGARGIEWRARRHGIRGASPADLCVLAAEKRKEARELWREFGEDLAKLLHTLVVFLAPFGVVIGGGTAGAAEWFLPHARKRLARTLPANVAAPEVVAAKHGPLAGAVGAAWAAAGGGGGSPRPS